jgi:hypothetical protein
MEETKQIISTDRKNSYEFGKAGNRHKVYYDTIEELKAIMDNLKLAGLVDDE